MKISNKLTIKAFYFAVLVSLLIFNSCSKDGADGVDGKDGLQGEQGIPGVDGATLLSGTGVPTTALGKNGDFYLDKSSIQIYGPKTSTGWGNPTSLKGADGKDGTNGKDGADGKDGKDGSKILSGNQIPTEKDGSIGDFYFDTQNIAIYGPKSSSGWGSPLSLKAPSSSDVTVLLYKNHSFQKITREANDNSIHNLESIIPIDSKYHTIYDEGLVIVQLRRSNDSNSSWDDDINYEENDKLLTTDRVDSNNLQKDKLVVKGYAKGYTNTEIQATKIDIKVVFIPASNVIEMKAKNIDTKNAKTVATHLNL